MGEHFAMHSGIGLQRGGKFPVNFPETFQKFPEDSKKKKFPKFLECFRNLLEIFHFFFATLFWDSLICKGCGIYLVS